MNGNKKKLNTRSYRSFNSKDYAFWFFEFIEMYRRYVYDENYLELYLVWSERTNEYIIEKLLKLLKSVEKQGQKVVHKNVR